MVDGISFIRDFAVILLAATAGGWLARRAGMSPVVGYLAAGLLVGTPEVTFLYVTDPAQVQVLSQVGLVFLMFSIGLGVRIRRIRELGAGPLVATVLTALFMLTLTRGVASLMGLSPVEGLFLAGMLMVSSSAIIGKILVEQQLLHQKPGQMALSQTLLEDFVAVVMLTFLGSLAAFEQLPGQGGAAVLQNLGKLAAFVLFFVITGLLILPWLLERVRRDSGPEIQVILVGGLLFGLALLTVLAGYSLALGAFLCGVLIAETPRSGFVEKAYSGMRDVFTAVFFVAIGMGIDLRLAFTAVDLIVAGLLLALVGRVVCSVVGWLVACETAPNAVRAALAVTPIGEFSFIIAALGVSSGLIPERFQIAAVGLSFLTSLMAPVMMARADRIAAFALLRQPGWLGGFGGAYRSLWSGLGARQQNHMLWRFLRKRFWQIGRELVWAVAILVFARPLYRWLVELSARRGDEVLSALLPLFWLVVLLVALVPLVSIVRNVQAVAMIIVEYFGRQSPGLRRHRQAWTLLLEASGIAIVLVGVANFLPWAVLEGWILGIFLAVSLLLAVLGWRRFIRLHSQAEYTLQGVWEGGATPGVEAWSETPRDWGLVLEEIVLPDPFSGAGRTIAELALRKRTGALVISVERHGQSLDSPGPQTHLFADDRVFLLGSPDQTRAARALLEQAAEDSPGTGWERAVLEDLAIPPDSPLLGQRLADLNWPRLYNVQVAAVRPAGEEPFAPGAEWRLQPGSEILLAGTPGAIRSIRTAMAGPAEQP